MTVRAVEARVFVHATEDKGKVLKALLSVVPEDLRSEIRVEEEDLEGHYGNPIVKLEFRVEGPAAGRVVGHILSNLSPADRGLLASSLEDRVDRNGVVYLRLSKQEAYQGRFYIYESDDVIRVAIHYTGGRARAVREFREALSSLEGGSNG